MKDWFVPILMAALGSLGFAMFFGIRSRKLIYSFLGGALTWSVYLIVMEFELPEVYAYALGAAAGTLYAELLARIIKTPVTLFIVTSVIPLVPGGALYDTMLGLLEGNHAEFTLRGVYTVTAAGAMALGMFSATMAFKLVFSIFTRPTIKPDR